MFWTWDGEVEIVGENGGAGEWLGPPVRAEAPFTALVASWNVAVPAGGVVSPAVRVYVPWDSAPALSRGGRGWSGWYTLARWGAGTHPATGESLPRSLPAAPAAPGPAWVDIDTLKLKPGRAATGFQMRVMARPGADDTPPRLYHLAATTYNIGPIAAYEDNSPFPTPRPAFRIAVPERSQRVEDPAIAGLICSPTALGMVLGYWGVEQPTAQVLAGVRDACGEETYGNWPFNAAYAGGQGLRAHVRHFASLDAVEAEVRRGHPVVLSVAWEAGELPEAPIPRTGGHLIVLTGVTEQGDFHVNDPAADPRQGQPIARIYNRERLARAANGIGYVIVKRDEL